MSGPTRPKAVKAIKVWALEIAGEIWLANIHLTKADAQHARKKFYAHKAIKVIPVEIRPLGPKEKR